MVIPIKMFLTENDYDTLILDEDRELISQSTESIREQAELMAVDQMSGYLRAKYDVDAIFDPADEDERSQVLVMFCMDITLYHLHAGIPGRFVPEIRRIRYEDALAWLKDVAKGLIDPGLTQATVTDPETGEEITVTPFLFGSNTKQDNSW